MINAAVQRAELRMQDSVLGLRTQTKWILRINLESDPVDVSQIQLVLIVL
jgi:hypothetical protein